MRSVLREKARCGRSLHALKLLSWCNLVPEEVFSVGRRRQPGSSLRWLTCFTQDRWVHDRASSWPSQTSSCVSDDYTPLKNAAPAFPRAERHVFGTEHYVLRFAERAHGQTPVSIPRCWMSSDRSGGEKDAEQDGERKKKLNDFEHTVLDVGTQYSVIDIDSNGSCNPRLVSSVDLGIHPRDLDLLVSSSFIPKRATIAVQNFKVIMRLENVRALVSRDHALLFDASRPRTSKFRGLNPILSDGADLETQLRNPETLERAKQAFASVIAEQANVMPPAPLEPMPFHLRIIECLLEETSKYFHQKVERLKVVGEKMLEELTNDVNMGGLQRLLPLKRAITEVEHDVRDIHDAMDQVLSSDDILEALCSVSAPEMAYLASSEEQREGHERKIRQAAADMFITYLREIDDAGGVLEELKKDMDAAVEVWELGLDATRNRIMRMNLFISIATVSLAVATVPANFFGMNLISGLEAHPDVFYAVLGMAATASLTVCSGLVFVYRVLPKFADMKRKQELSALRDLLKNLDDIDEIFQSIARGVAGKPVSPEEFRRIIRDHPASRFMRKKELDLLFRMFDSDRNGLVEAADWSEPRERERRYHGASPRGGD